MQSYRNNTILLYQNFFDAFAWVQTSIKWCLYCALLFMQVVPESQVSIGESEKNVAPYLLHAPSEQVKQFVLGIISNMLHQSVLYHNIKHKLCFGWLLLLFYIYKRLLKSKVFERLIMVLQNLNVLTSSGLLINRARKPTILLSNV